MVIGNARALYPTSEAPYTFTYIRSSKGALHLP